MPVHARQRLALARRAVLVGCFVAAATSSHHAQTAAYFSATDSMATARAAAPAVPLADGTVLVLPDGTSSAFADLYDPAAGRFALTGAMTTARSDAAAVRLADGRVLVVGGWNGIAALAAAEIYDPASRTFQAAGPLLLPRVRPAIARLSDGRVLVAGGHDGTSAYASAEVYDPATGTSSLTGNMSSARAGTATLLPGGRVLVLGGPSADAAATSADVYDPAANVFTPTGALNIARSHYAATPLADGRVLVTGGLDQAGLPIADAELYDGTAGAFRLSGRMVGARSDQNAVVLGDGTVLALGGRDGGGVLSSAELYDPATGTFTIDATLAQARTTPIVAPLPDGGALVAGGRDATAGALATAERYWRARPADTTTGVTSSLPSSTYGQAVTYTATVSSASAVPSGVVQFFDGGVTLLGQAPLTAAGQATLTISTTPAGTRAISAIYTGSTAFNRSQSPAIQQVVGQATATGTFIISPGQRQYSDPVTFTATVSPADAAQSVTFKLGTLVIGTADVQAGRAALTTPVLASMPLGTKIITAVFNQTLPNYVLPSISKSMSIIREDARIEGDPITVYTACPTCTTAKVHLKATVWDISVTPDAAGDVWPGDIRNATVTFANRTTPATIATVPVTLTDPSVLTTGEAVYEWTVDIGTAATKTINVGYTVGGLYTRTTYDVFTVTVSKPK
jgi:Big-like domain-containing protein/Kelch motif protein